MTKVETPIGYGFREHGHKWRMLSPEDGNESIQSTIMLLL